MAGRRGLFQKILNIALIVIMVFLTIGVVFSMFNIVQIQRGKMEGSIDFDVKLIVTNFVLIIICYVIQITVCKPRE